MSKKLNFVIIFLIFAIPIGLYYFINMPADKSSSTANASMGRPKVLQFTSKMCYDCKRIEKEIAPLRSQYSGKVVFKKIDVSSSDQTSNFLVEKYGIKVVPTLVFLNKNGSMEMKKEGYMTKSQIKECLDSLNNG